MVFASTEGGGGCRLSWEKKVEKSLHPQRKKDLMKKKEGNDRPRSGCYKTSRPLPHPPRACCALQKEGGVRRDEKFDNRQLRGRKS